MPDGSHAWEENRTISRPRAYDAEGRPLWYEWVFNRQLTAHDFYSARELVLTLVDMVSRGGNLVLNVGPTPDGRLRAIEEERLTQVGDWLKMNGEAIFGTRPWVRSCQWSAGQRPPIKYGSEWRQPYDIAALTAKPAEGHAAIEAFFTAKDDALYAILPRWPSQPVHLKGVRASAQTEVTMLGMDRSLKWTARPDGLKIVLPAMSVDELPCEHAFALKLAHARS